jgi:hypothetical protein
MLKSQVKEILTTIEDMQANLDKTARSAFSVSFPTTSTPAPVPVSVLARETSSRVSRLHEDAHSYVSARPPQGTESQTHQSRISVSSETTSQDWADTASRSSRLRY